MPECLLEPLSFVDVPSLAIMVAAMIHKDEVHSILETVEIAHLYIRVEDTVHLPNAGVEGVIVKFVSWTDNHDSMASALHCLRQRPHHISQTPSFGPRRTLRANKHHVHNVISRERG
jgi:hypothetical protein